MNVDPKDIVAATNVAGNMPTWMWYALSALAGILGFKRLSAKWAEDSRDKAVADADTSTYKRLNDEVTRLSERVAHLEATVLNHTMRDIRCKQYASEILRITSTLCIAHCGGNQGGPADRIVDLCNAILNEMQFPDAIRPDTTRPSVRTNEIM